jgi:hypothetical protein
MPEEPRDLVPSEQLELPQAPDLESLLPIAPVGDLTTAETGRLQQFQTALVQLGQAAGGALVCPGNQIGVPDERRCPYAAKCELLKVLKAPQGELCPIEREVILARFHGWSKMIEADPKNLREDQRAVISELVWIDVQEQRCTNILSRGEAALLTQISVKDSNPETGEWISWERIVHSNTVLLESLHTRRRMIMKEWMLTPEQRFKAAKAMGKLGSGDDIGKKLSARADKLRDLDVDTIDAEYIDVPTRK